MKALNPTHPMPNNPPRPQHSFSQSFLSRPYPKKPFPFIFPLKKILFNELLGVHEICSKLNLDSGNFYHATRITLCRIDIPYPFQWGVPTFNFGDALTMMFASFVASVKSTGVFLASARYGSATPVPPSVIGRGVGWLGIGTGLPFRLPGKFGAIFASIPASIMAAIYCFCFGYVSSAGLGFLQFCNLNSFRTKFILGFSLFLGLSLPQYFREQQLCSGSGPLHTHSRWFNDIMSVIFMSHATVAAIVAVFLDRTLPFSNDEARKDNGSHWSGKGKMKGKDFFGEGLERND